MKVLCFGDSITEGYNDSEGGWVNRLGKILKDKAELINFGVSGDSTYDLLDRLQDETEQYSKEDIVIIIAIGTNDSRIESSHNFIEIEEFKRNLGEIVSLVRKFSNNILFIGLTPCDETLTIPVDWGRTFYTNVYIKKYDDAIYEFCKKSGISYVEIFEPFKIASMESNLLSDGLHPNDAGHQLMAELIKPHLQKIIES